MKWIESNENYPNQCKEFVFGDYYTYFGIHGVDKEILSKATFVPVELDILNDICTRIRGENPNPQKITLNYFDEDDKLLGEKDIDYQLTYQDDNKVSIIFTDGDREIFFVTDGPHSFFDQYSNDCGNDLIGLLHADENMAVQLIGWTVSDILAIIDSRGRRFTATNWKKMGEYFAKWRLHDIGRELTASKTSYNSKDVTVTGRVGMRCFLNFAAFFSDILCEQVKQTAGKQ